MADSGTDVTGAGITAAAPDALLAKATPAWGPMFVLAMLSGAFIAFGSIGYLVVRGIADPVTGPVALLSGLAFSVGLILVTVTGSELFTGNTMFVLPGLIGKLHADRLFASWVVVWAGNLVGSLLVAWLFVTAGGTHAASGLVGSAAVDVAATKAGKSVAALLASGVLANTLVCLAVWMAMGARTIGGKIAAVVGPVTLFVAAGFEHSVANMSILPIAWLAAAAEPNAALHAAEAGKAAAITLPAVLRVLALSTVGNVIGGALVSLGFGYAHGSFAKRPG